jgi:hypothetical protein
MVINFRRLATATALAGACTLAIAGTAAAASTSTHHVKPSATAPCGSSCFDLSNVALGPSLIQNAWSNGGKIPVASRKINLRQASNSFPAEDFQVYATGQVREFCGAVPGDFSPTSWQCLNIPNHFIFEANYAPLGVQTDLCAGAASATAGAAVQLETCGTTTKTLWIGDTFNACGPVTLNGETTATSNTSGDTDIHLNGVFNHNGVVDPDSVQVTDTTTNTAVPGTDYTLFGDHIVLTHAFTHGTTPPAGDSIEVQYTYTFQRCANEPLPTRAQPWVNGGSQTSSHPLVLTLKTGSKKPPHALVVEPENLSNGVVPDSSMFVISPGPAA